MQTGIASASIVAGGNPGNAQVTFPFSGLVPGEVLSFSGPSNYIVDLAMMPAAGLRAMLVSIDALDATGAPAADPVKVTFKGPTVGFFPAQTYPGGYHWINPGGWIGFATSQLVTGGINSLMLDTTAACIVRVWALG